jgi:hypothetical protein
VRVRVPLGLDAQGRRNVPDVKPREQHADDREVIDVEPRRGRLDELRIWRRYPRGPGGGRVDRRQQRLDGVVLGDDRVRLCERRGHREGVVDVGGVEHDARWVRALLEAEAGAEPIPARQRVVHDHHVGPVTVKRDRELRFARDRTEQPVAGLLVEQLLEARAQCGMVVDDEH